LTVATGFFLLRGYYEKSSGRSQGFFTCLRYGIVTISGEGLVNRIPITEAHFLRLHALQRIFLPGLSMQFMRLKFTCPPDGRRDCGGSLIKDLPYDTARSK
jgi:hypothetical protein